MFVVLMAHTQRLPWFGCLLLLAVVNGTTTTVVCVDIVIPVTLNVLRMPVR